MGGKSRVEVGIPQKELQIVREGEGWKGEALPNAGKVDIIVDWITH
jgi:hypothetical protein